MAQCLAERFRRWRFGRLAEAAHFRTEAGAAAAATNDYVGKIVLTVTGMAPGTTNRIEKYLDLNGTKYAGWIRTDSLGNYHLRAISGTWQLELDCNDLRSRGYDCPAAVQTNVNSGQVTVNLVVPAANPLRINSSFLANGKVGTAYRFQLSASGGQPPYNWALALGSASLPPGLSLSSDGVLSGAPTVGGEFKLILTARDSNLTSVSQTFGITITGQAALSLPARLSGTQFRMNLSGDPGQNYTLQYSDTLTAWTTLLVTNAPIASFPIIDQNATNASRFYRIVVGPSASF